MRESARDDPGKRRLSAQASIEGARWIDVNLIVHLHRTEPSDSA